MRPGELQILVIDDEEIIRNSMAAFLEDMDVYVSQAESAEVAISLMAARSFHMVIVDLRLPGISGEDFIQKVAPIFPKTRFMIHTGSVDYQLSPKLASLGLGPEHILSKPLPSMDHLQKIIDKLSREVMDE